MAREIVLDRDGDWLRRTFLAPRSQITAVKLRRLLMGDVQWKFTDASLGGNYYLNPPPQHTRFADIRIPGRLLRSVEGGYDGTGAGRWWSEAYDDNAQILYLRFGVASPNAMTTFWAGFYNSEASVLARTGRADGVFYKFGRALGFIASLPLWPLILVGTAYRWGMHMPASKYYYLKPTMPLYWNALNNMVNRVAVNIGIVPEVLGNPDAINGSTQRKYLTPGEEITDNQITQADFAKFHQMAPDIYSARGGIDIYAVANKAARIQINEQDKLNQLIDASTFSGSNGKEVNLDLLAKNLSNYMWDPSNSAKDPSTKGLDTILDSYLASPGGSRKPPTDANGATATTDANSDTKAPPEIEERTGRAYEDANGNIKNGWLQSFFKHAEAEFADGSEFVAFRVNHTGSASESFSNSTRESDIASSINAKSSQARMMKFAFGNGNIGNDAVSNTVETILGTAKDFVAGLADGIQISGIAALWGSAFVDIPKVWDNSTFSQTTASFTIELRAIYGNDLCRFNTLMVPLLAILAGSLPLSTGKHSYTSPLLCEYYCKGRNQSRLAIIESLSITRGVGNVGWTADGKPLAIDVTINLADLSSIMHMPIASEPWFNPLRGIFDEDTAFNDYMAVLGSLGLMDQIYKKRRLSLALTRAMVRFDRMTSPARFATWFNGNTIPGKFINLITQAVDRPK